MYVCMYNECMYICMYACIYMYVYICMYVYNQQPHVITHEE